VLDVEATAPLEVEATQLLRALIRADTSNPPGRETAAARVLERYLQHHGVECELVARDPDRANVVARIAGKGEGPSLGLFGHTDVVPADDAAAWTHPPFAGVVDAAGWIWGRGAADMKNEVATRAVAFVALARGGYQPAGDLLLIAEADEENGSAQAGLPWLVQERPDLRVDYALNEGAAERLRLADGRTIVTVAVGEKGAVRADITALGAAAPSSLPWSGENAVPRLAELIGRLEGHRPVFRGVPQTMQLLDELVGEDGTIQERLGRATALHPMLHDLLAPLFQMTIASTQLVGSGALNVMPAQATVSCDCRTVPGMTVVEIGDELEAVLGDDVAHRIDFCGEPEGGSASPTDTPLYAAISEWLALNDPEAALLPTLCNGFTNSHYLREAWGTIAYGIWPLRRTPTDVLHAGVHAVDERVHSADLGYATRFHIEVCRAFDRLSRGDQRPPGTG
jgi:acetylornithine deacetylase/succinyl-diaminopimelate desuccinylase-like protein